MKKSIGIIFLSLFFAQTALAEPPTRASVEKLLQVTNAAQRTEDQYAMMQPIMADMIKKIMPQSANSAEMTEAVNIMLPKMVKLFREQMGWSAFKEDYINLYRSTMTQTEIYDLTKFYESPTGKSYLVKIPLITQKITQTSMQKMQLLYPQIQQIIRETAAEMGSKANGAKQP